MLHTDTSQFRHTYLVKYQTGEDERTLLRVVPRDKNLRRLHFIDRNIRKRPSHAAAAAGAIKAHNTREMIPEAELVTILMQQPMSGCVEVVRGNPRRVEFVQFSTTLPSERYVNTKKTVEEDPWVGGLAVAEDIESLLLALPVPLPARCTPSLGQLRVYVRNLHSSTTADKVAAFNLGPAALCACVLPYWVFTDVAVQLDTGRLPHSKPGPFELGLPRGLWEPYDGFYGLRR